MEKQRFSRTEPARFLLICSAVCLAAFLGVAEMEAATSQTTISLSGEWRFQLDPEGRGLEERWFESDLPDTIALPGSTAENGYGEDISADTRWTGRILSRSWHRDARFEKYRQPGSTKVTFWLQPRKHYVGPAWYQKRVVIPEAWRGKQVHLFLERCHWETQVWVDGTPVGAKNSLAVPHEYDLSSVMTPGEHNLTICVDNTVKINVGPDAHSVSDQTQTNWNGIIGKIVLIARDKVWISDMQVYPDLPAKAAKVRVEIANATGEPVEGVLTLAARSWNGAREHVPPTKEVSFSIGAGESTIDMEYLLGEGVQLWSEFSPTLYKLDVALEARGEVTGYTDSKTVDFGMRAFGTDGTQFTLNGKKIFLRGTLECCIFPLTGYPSMDVEAWLRILSVAGSHGLNNLRFHSWCPPEAAFVAADRMGFVYQVECGAWTSVGDGKDIDRFIYDEGDRILKTYGNHPSFCLLAYGNEPGGKNHKRFLGDLVDYWKTKDPRRLYTGAAGWPIIPESQYHNVPEPRVHAWGAGLKSRFNSSAFETMTDYRDYVAMHDVPVVSHEIGQWCVYPNFKEIEKYTGVLKARNFEIFRDMLEENHMLDQAEDFLMASGKLQTLCYKEEIESALRTPGFGGFQLLDLHDFPGQGTALVGVLDPFWDSKGYVTPEEYHRFACETVPLVRMEKCTWTTDETFSAGVEIAHFGPAPLEDARPIWSIADSNGNEVASGKLRATDIPIGNGFQLGRIDLPLSKVTAPQKLSLRVSIEKTPYENDWGLWVYPKNIDTDAPKSVLVADALDRKVLRTLRRGGKVLLMPAPGSVNGDGRRQVPPGFSPIFWNTAWTRNQPPHTLGILCNPDHPALAEFPTEFHSNWQWWELIHTAQIMILNDFPPGLRPAVQVIDDWNTNRRLGLIFEAEVNGGKLLVCGIDLENDLDTRIVARQMRRSLLTYMASGAFSPAQRLDAATLNNVFKSSSAARK